MSSDPSTSELPSASAPASDPNVSNFSKTFTHGKRVYEEVTETRFFGRFQQEVTVTKEVKREKRKYRCRKRSPATIERAKTVRRDKANARERRRMNSLNDALEHLRTILPALPDEPKMTKIETLKKAQDYISAMSFHLSNNCDGISCGCCSTNSSIQSTPFQSPCFPPPTPSYQVNSMSSQYNNHVQNQHQYFSPSYPHP